jgi:hypothetical protein
MNACAAAAIELHDIGRTTASGLRIELLEIAVEIRETCRRGILRQFLSNSLIACRVR